MVFTGRRRSSTAADMATTAMRDAGIFLDTLGQRIRMARARHPTRAAVQLTVWKVRAASAAFSTVSTGAWVKVRPKKSLS